MIQAVFDTTVLVSALLNKTGLSASLISQCEAGRFELHLSDEIIAETRRSLLYRPHIRKKYTYTDETVEQFTSDLRSISQLVSDVPALKVVRDEDDDFILACAVKAKAQYLVTRDKDLLSLGVYETIQIIKPEEFIALVRSQGAADQPDK